MCSPGLKDISSPFARAASSSALRPSDVMCRGIIVLLLFGLALLMWTDVACGQIGDQDEEFDEVDRPGMEQLDRLNELLRRAGEISLRVGAVLLGLVILKILSPIQLYHGTQDRRLKRAVRGIDELLKRIEEEAVATGDEPSETPTEGGGILAGMMEVAEFEEGEQVPSYVLTVNDLMLDNMGDTFKRLRRFSEGDAARYRDYMFGVLEGIKTLTEQSAAAGAASGLAVDLKDYFEDEKRYRLWKKLLTRFARKGRYQEPAEAFLLFMDRLKEGRPVAPPAKPSILLDNGSETTVEVVDVVPHTLDEETLPVIQEAAACEAANLCALVRAGRQEDEDHAWQFEFVRRQQQVHLRSAAQKMLAVFLATERRRLLKLAKIRMLPCRAWPHVLHMLGVENAAQLRRRIDDKLLTAQEIIILEKAFLQTFAKRQSLQRVYGQGDDAEMMIDLHVPQVRREALAMLRRSYESQPRRLDQATSELNEEETPEHSEVRRLIEHYVHHRHDPPTSL